MILSNYAIKFRTAVFVSAVALVLFGAWSYRTLPREGMPDITIPHVFVTAVYEGTAPEEIEKLIAIPLEKQLNDVDGIRKLSSVSSENVAMIDVEFVAGEDIDMARQRVKDKVDLARRDLPADLDEPLVQALNTSSDIPILIFSLSGGVDRSRLEALGDRLRDEIELLPGVKQALVSGKREREIRVEVDLDRLMGYGIPLPQVMDRIARENRTLSAGSMEMGGSKFQVRVPGEFEAVSEIRDILVAEPGGHPVYLRDLATVTETHKDIDTISRLNGTPSVSVSVKKRAGENSVGVIDRIKAQLDGVALPPGIRLTYVYDESDYVAMMIKELESNVVTGFLLVILVLFIFMGGRNSLFVALAIPMSMLVAFSVMGAMGFSLNMIVLFSLVLAVGMLVDNAIVIVENIYRHHSEGMGRAEAARLGAGEVAWPVITSTLTTCAAFSPLLFWPDLMGQFMGFLPRTLIVVLSASLFVAIVVNPAVCSVLISTAGRGAMGEGKARHPFVKAYEALLRWLLGHRLAALSLALLGFALTVEVYALLGRGYELFPEVDPRNATIQVKYPQGTGIGKPDAVLRDIEKELARHEDIKFYLTTVGELGGFSFNAGGNGTHVGNIHVEFKDMHERTGSSMALIGLLREAIGEVPGAEIRVERQEEGPPTGAPVSIEVYGDDFEELGALADRIVRLVDTVPGLVDLQTDREDALPELQFRVDRQRAALLGLSTDAIGGFLRTAIYGMESSRFRVDEDEFDITVRLPEAQRDSAALMARLSIPLPDGRLVPLASVGRVVYTGGRGAITRKDRKRVITITGNDAGRGVDKIIADIRARLAELRLPTGYELKYAGDTEEMNKSARFLGRAFTVAIGLIVIVLVIQFNSTLLPLIILVSVLLSVIGVMWGLILCRMKFGVIMTGVGVISLAGIVVNNAIVLVDCIQQRRGEGLSPAEAIVTAGRLRLRPVLLTAMTTILGLIPMAIGFSLDIHAWPPRLVAGAETSAMWAPMAVAVIFGLALATLLTLLLVPVMYSLVDGAIIRIKHLTGLDTRPE